MYFGYGFLADTFSFSGLMLIAKRFFDLANFPKKKLAIAMLFAYYSLGGKALAGGEYHFEKALQYQFSGDPKAAIAEYRQGLAAVPDSVEGHTKLGSLLLDEEGDVDGAISEFVTALSIDPGCVFCQSRLDEAMSYKNASAKEEIAHGNDFYRSGQLSRAAACYRIAIACDPNDTEAHNCLAWTLYRQGKLEEGQIEVHQALRLKPEEPEYVNTLACIQFDRGDIDGALVSFRKAIAKSKTPNPADLYGLALVFLTKGNTAEAVKNFREAVKTDSGYASVAYIRDKIGMSVHALASHEKLSELSEKK